MAGLPNSLDVLAGGWSAYREIGMSPDVSVALTDAIGYDKNTSLLENPIKEAQAISSNNLYLFIYFFHCIDSRLY